MPSHGKHTLSLPADALVRQWLREEVAPVYDAMQADPARGLSSDEVRAALSARHAETSGKKTRGARGDVRRRGDG